MNLFILSIIIFLIAIIMASVGKGGGNFYVITLVLAGFAIQEAATSSQFIMFGTSLAASLIFSKHKRIDWLLTLIIGPSLFIMAYVGGLFAESMHGVTLKIFFASLLVLMSIFMLIKVKEKTAVPIKKFGFIHRHTEEYSYTVNLWIAVPVTGIIGFFSGAVGISGGSFIIPLIVLLFGVHMPIAIGTSSVMVTITALSGFLGHISANPTFNYKYALILLIAAVLGGIIGGLFSVKNKPKNLKTIFGITNLVAALLMIFNIIFG